MATVLPPRATVIQPISEEPLGAQSHSPSPGHGGPVSKRQAVPPRLTQTRPSCPPLSHRSPLTTLALHRRTQATPSSFPPRCGLRLPLVSEQGHPGHDTPAAAIARSRSQWRGPGTSSPRRVTHCVAGATTRRTPYSSKLDLEQGTRHLAINYPPMGHRTPLFLFPDWAAGCGLFTYTDQPTGRLSRVAHPVFTPSCCSREPCSASPVGSWQVPLKGERGAAGHRPPQDGCHRLR
ncbi:uncharacterized protein LOC128136063 [Harpia harpyja]|uniref:uncharacterized protein LOC128136063 n=1 Tax=Harpia harpyja TaxID=202280 RepID=UPI0022B19916|nr:uncharacterized protein LOC128136063 [Harpia harpyja]